MDFGTKVSSFFFAFDLTVFLLVQSYMEWQKYCIRNKSGDLLTVQTGNTNLNTNIRPNSNVKSIFYINSDNNPNTGQIKNDVSLRINEDRPRLQQSDLEEENKEKDFFFGNRLVNLKYYYIVNCSCESILL